MVAGYAPWHNFVRIRKMLRKTPANAAGIETRPRSNKDGVAPIGQRWAMRTGLLPVA